MSQSTPIMTHPTKFPQAIAIHEIRWFGWHKIEYSEVSKDAHAISITFRVQPLDKPNKNEAKGF